MRNRNDVAAKFMRKQDAKEKAKARKALREQQEAMEQEQKAPEETVLPKNFGKTTGLVFFRQYNTYQALFSIHPGESIDVDGCFKKTVLHIMKWFSARVGEDAYAENPEIRFLKDDYPDPEQYADFRIENAKDINTLDFVDLETAYLPEKNAWLFDLIEPDNGQEGRDIRGRTFATQIMVYKETASVTLGVRISCREPRTNSEDATVFRPGFMAKIFIDPDLIISEHGMGPEYEFGNKPIIVNGKAQEACNKLFTELIASDNRQMPILFIPGDFYENNETEVNEKCTSLLGFCHIVVWQSACRKLFDGEMHNEEFADVADEGQLILYRTNYLQEYEPVYYEADCENVLNIIKTQVKKEPLRKLFDYKEYDFKPSWWEVSKRESAADSEDVANVRKEFEAEIEKLKKANNELRRDSDSLQRKIDELEKENSGLDDLLREDAVEISAMNKEIDYWKGEFEAAKKGRQAAEAQKMMLEMQNRGLRNMKEIYKPLFNLPPLGLDKKEEILDWIREYYSDVLEIHPNAEKSFFDDKKNIDWRRFCMMIHYLAGYTRYRNDGGKALDNDAAREYDVENSAYKVTPVSSGQGTVEMHKDKYTITVDGKDVKMDLHVKYGKGADSEMIRIYFYYSPELKKSVIGYMPAHLPTRKDGH